LCVEATEPLPALLRKKLSLQYCFKLSANTNNPAYNAVFNSKFKTQFDCKPSQTRPLGFRVSASTRRMSHLQQFGQSRLGYFNALLVISVYAAMTKQPPAPAQKSSNANSLSFAQSFLTILRSTQMHPRMELEQRRLLLHPTLSKQSVCLTILVFSLLNYMRLIWHAIASVQFTHSCDGAFY